MGREYHVAKTGSDQNAGTAESPFASIQHAADLVCAGDTVIVHEGIYREWVRPRRGGLSDSCRITYGAATGEHVEIRGSERITGWEPLTQNVWKVTIDNSFFGEFNPYAAPLGGDWFRSPISYQVHTGEIYLNGKSLYEAANLEQVSHPTKRLTSPHETWGGRAEAILL